MQPVYVYRYDASFLGTGVVRSVVVVYSLASLVHLVSCIQGYGAALLVLLDFWASESIYNNIIYVYGATQVFGWTLFLSHKGDAIVMILPLVDIGKRGNNAKSGEGFV